MPEPGVSDIDLFERLREGASKKQRRAAYEEEYLIQLMKLIGTDDLEKIKAFLEIAKTNSYDLNRTVSGFTPLTYCAAKSGNEKVISLLLEKGATVQDGHLLAIFHGNVMTAEKLLNIIAKDEKLEMEPVQNSARFPSNLTPLVLAATIGSRDAIEMLRLRGHSIVPPHLLDCTCSECRRPHSFEFYRQRFDLYRALANPVYVELTEENVFAASIHYSLVINQIIECGDPFAESYEKLKMRLEENCSQLIQCSHYVDEAALVMQQDFDGFNVLDYPIFYAILCARWKLFLSQPMIQAFRNQFWTDSRNRRLSRGTWFSRLFSFRVEAMLPSYLCSILLDSIVCYFSLINGQSSLRYVMLVWAVGYLVGSARKIIEYGCPLYFQSFIHFHEILLILSLTWAAVGPLGQQHNLFVAVASLMLYMRVLLTASLRFVNGISKDTGRYVELVVYTYIIAALIGPSIAFAEAFLTKVRNVTAFILPLHGCRLMYQCLAVNFVALAVLELRGKTQVYSDAVFNYHWTYFAMLNYRKTLPVPLNMLQLFSLVELLQKRYGAASSKETVDAKDLSKTCIQTLVDRKNSK